MCCLQALSKKLVGGSGATTCLAVHPSGDHVLVGAEDKRLAWCAIALEKAGERMDTHHCWFKP